MSRTKFTRALIALASLLGAIPLMAQAAPTTTPAEPFPFGTYALVARDSVNGPPPGMSVEFTPTALKVMRGGLVIETHGLSVANGVLETFTLGEGCTDPGTYRWRVAGKLLFLEVVADPCSNRAMAISSVQFERE